jgi:hypothetical protein
MRRFAAIGAVAAMVGLAACDDGRLDTIPGVDPATETAPAPPADATWDTLHPPVPPAPGVETPATGEPGSDGDTGTAPASMTEPPADG